MAPNTYLYSTNLLEIWCMIPEKLSGIMYQIPRRLDVYFLNYNQTRFQINEQLYISNADPRLNSVTEGLLRVPKRSRTASVGLYRIQPARTN